MKEEIDAAAKFLTQLVSQNQPANISDDQLQQFKFHLARLFEERFHVSSITCYLPPLSHGMSLILFCYS